MIGEAFIYDSLNKQWLDIYTEYGATISEGTLASLLAPAPMKAYITNTSRIENGIHIVTKRPRVDSREVTLTVTLIGTNPTDFSRKFRKFVSKLQEGEIHLKFGADDLKDANGDDIVYNLVYTKSSTYAKNPSRTICKMAVKLTEYNPAKRTL